MMFESGEPANDSIPLYFTLPPDATAFPSSSARIAKSRESRSSFGQTIRFWF